MPIGANPAAVGGLSVVLLIAACSAVTPASPSLAVVESRPAGTPLSPPDTAAGTRWELGGRPVPTAVISLVTPPDHGGRPGIRLRTIGWPLGTQARTEADARQYVRDAAGEHPYRTHGRFEPHDVVPADAAFTGYTFGGDELWLWPTTATSAAYLVRGKVVEAWPRAVTLFGCA